MCADRSIPVNTLDQALERAEDLMRDLADEGSKASRHHRIFSALAADERAGLAAFLIWQTRGETLQELAHGG